MNHKQSSCFPELGIVISTPAIQGLWYMCTQKPTRGFVVIPVERSYPIADNVMSTLELCQTLADSAK